MLLHTSKTVVGVSTCVPVSLNQEQKVLHGGDSMFGGTGGQGKFAIES